MIRFAAPLLVEIAGAAAVVYGIARVCVPAAFIVGGLFAIVAATAGERLLAPKAGDST